MFMRKSLALLAAIAIGVPIAIQAQQQPSRPQSASGWGETTAQSAEEAEADLPADPERGRQAASESCVNCHGENGRSPTNATPSLAGQPAPFIVMQMVLFRNEMRNTPPMPDFARDLTEQQVEDLAAFFASLPPGPPEDREAKNEARFRQGAAVAERLRCASCHHADYAGRNQVPRVAQQREDYLVPVLSQYRSGDRSGYDIAMNAILQGVSDDDIAALAHFLAHLD